ncbi:hypothetical protein FHR49_000250 [Xanthomonas campestris]
MSGIGARCVASPLNAVPDCGQFILAIGNPADVARAEKSANPKYFQRDMVLWNPWQPVLLADGTTLASVRG